MPVKVCHFTSVHTSKDIRIFLKECVSLAKAGFDVTLVAANCKSEVIDNVKIIGVECETKSRLDRMLKTAKSVFEKALEVDADIYHFHDPELLRFALQLKRKGKKVIYDAHEDVPKQILSKYWINKFFRKTISSLVKNYENRVAKQLDYIITATPSIRDRFLSINTNCIDINNFPLENELASVTPWHEKTNNVCYIGGMTVIRGIHQLVDAIDLSNDIKLILAGNFSPANLENEIETKRGYSKVVYKGMVNREGVASIMAKSKAGLVTFMASPNHIDAQPNKMFEYMSAGIPVIASHFPLWKEIIDGNKCGICVDPEKPAEIAKAINYTTGNNEQAEQMGKNGREAVVKKYNWKIESDKLVNVYKSLSK